MVSVVWTHYPLKAMSFGSFQLKESKWNTHSKCRGGSQELPTAQIQVEGQLLVTS